MLALRTRVCGHIWPVLMTAIGCLLAMASEVLAQTDDARERGVRGVVRAEASATISSELVARIASMPFKVGQAFQAGDVLLTFDCRRYEAEFRAAEAEVKTQAIAVETHRKLLKYKATGTNDLAMAEAKHAQAVASADALRVRIGQCIITAPYSGRIVERTVDIFEMPQANAPLVRIVKDGQLEVDIIVPSQWSAHLKPGFEFSFKIDETDTVHSARILYPGALVDPVSRTMRLTANLLDPGSNVRPGMSGSALLRSVGRETK